MVNRCQWKMACDYYRTKLCILIVIFFTFFGCLFKYRQYKAEYRDQYCYNSDPQSSVSFHVGSVKAYRFVQPLKEDRQYYLPNCKAVKAWMVIRHGTRLPEPHMQRAFAALEPLRDNIIKNYAELQSAHEIDDQLCAEDLDKLKQWRWDTNITEEHEEFLTQEGVKELKSLAVRFHQALPNLFEDKFDRKKFDFRFTNTERILESYRRFADGLFGENANQNISIEPLDVNSILLNPYTICDSWKQSLKSSFAERKKLEKSLMFTLLVRDVSIRLGFKRSLGLEKILDMYNMCRYGFAWEIKDSSPWCAVFTPNQLKVLEFREDVKYYYDDGPGQPESVNMPCHIISDMVRQLESDNAPKVVVNFIHSTAIRIFLSAMNLGNDTDPITADNYESKADRKWRGGKLFPFGGNFAAIKYSCPKTTGIYKMKFFLHEKPIDLTWCKNNLCDLADVRGHFQRFLDGNCDTLFCKNATMPATA